MFIFHVVFWLLSVIFAVQLWQIRREQRDLYRRELAITKKLIDKEMDTEDHKRKIDNRLDVLEENLKKLKDGSNL